MEIILIDKLLLELIENGMKKLSRNLMLVGALLLPNLVSADVWQERELLERWIAQTESLYAILDEAATSSNEIRRPQMNYSMLKKEMSTTVLKVKHYLNAPTVPFNEYEAKMNLENVISSNNPLSSK